MNGQISNRLSIPICFDTRYLCEVKYVGPGQYFKDEFNNSISSANTIKNSYRSIFKSKVSKLNNDKSSTNKSVNPKLSARIKSQKEARAIRKI